MSQLIDVNAKFLIFLDNKYYHGTWDLYEQLRTEPASASEHEISLEKANEIYQKNGYVVNMNDDENPEIEFIHRAIVALNKRHENGVPFGHINATIPALIRSVALGIKYFDPIYEEHLKSHPDCMIMTYWNRKKLEDKMCRDVAKDGFSVIAVFGEAGGGYAYTKELIYENKPLTLFTCASNIGATKLGQITTDIARTGNFTLNTPFELEDFKVGENNLRYMLIDVSEIIRITKGAEYLGDRVYLICLPDINNVLDGEEGFDSATMTQDLISCFK